MVPIHAALQGLTAAERKLERCADRLARAPLADTEGDSVSLSEEAAGLLAARNAYVMNLHVVDISDQMINKLVDFLA